MKSHAPVLASRVAYNRALLARIEAGALTNEDRAVAILNRAMPHKKGQGVMVFDVPPNAGVAPCGQPEPSGLAVCDSLGD